MKLTLLALVAGIGLYFLGQFGESRLPGFDTLKNAMAKPPVQTMLPADTPAINIKFEKKSYTLNPRADYVLEGLIVSQHRSDSIFDLMHSRTGDYLNSRDFCTVWGFMLSSGTYEHVEFWSGDWTCNFQANAEWYPQVRLTEIANNHILADNPKVRDAIEGLEKGDEIRVRGKLVDYAIDGVPFRQTSLVRDDTGNGACETLYVESVEVLQSHNRFWRFIRKFGALVVVLSVLTVIGFMIRSIFFGETEHS